MSEKITNEIVLECIGEKNTLLKISYLTTLNGIEHILRGN